MQQICNNFLADPTDTSFGFQIKCKNCQFTRKQHIQNINAKPIPQTTTDNTASTNPKQLVNVVENAFQNPKNQVGMYGSLHQKKDIATTKTNEQSEFKKTTSLNQQQGQKDESDLQMNNSIKLERQNLQIYNSEKASTNSNPQDQINKANEPIKEQISKEQSLNPSVQEDSNSSQKLEQIQNQNESKPNEPQEQKPNKLQSNPFILQNQNSPQKLESKSNISQPFQIKPQVQIIKDQKEQQQTINQSQNQSQPQNEQIINSQPQNEQIINSQPQNEQIVKPQTQNEESIKPQTQVEQPIKPQTQNEQKPQGNLQIPQANQNTNQPPQSVKDRAKGMQVFGFGAPPPIKIALKPDQERPTEQFIIDRPILQNKKHIRTQQDFQAIEK